MSFAAAYHGKIDQISETEISGWAAANGGDGEPLNLVIAYQDQLIGEARADGVREDLERAGKGACAFRFALPNIAKFDPDQIKVLIKGTDISLKRAWSVDKANIGPRSDLNELTDAVILTRKTVLAAVSRNERALIGMTETLGKVTPKQITDSLHSLSYQQMQTQAAIGDLKEFIGSTVANQQALASQVREVKRLVLSVLLLCLILLGVLSHQFIDWMAVVDLWKSSTQ